MAQVYVRLAKTPEVQKALSALKRKHSLLSEAEILKLALSKEYQHEQDEAEKYRKARKAHDHAMKEGRKIGIRLMKQRGLDPKKVTEQQFYELFLDDHKHA